MSMILGLLFLYLSLNFLIIMFFVGASEQDYYEGEDNE